MGVVLFFFQWYENHGGNGRGLKFVPELQQTLHKQVYVICKHTVFEELPPSFTQEGEEEEEGREEEGGREEWREEGVREDLGVFCWRSCNTVRCCCFGGVGE